MVVVGAGTGASCDVFGEWPVPSVVLVEADESCERQLAALAQAHQGWSAITACAGESDGEMDFFVASNPAESGLIAPDRLTRLWRNLRTREQRKLRTLTLDEILSNSQAQDANWAMIDCLPALPVLRGAANCLDRLDVLICRVVLDETRLAADGASEREVDAFLSSRGFRCVAQEEELHPALGVAIYARDLRIAHEEQRNALAGREQQVGQLSQANEALIQSLEDQRAQLNDLIRERDEQAQLAAGALEQMRNAAQERDEQARLAAGALEQVRKAAQEQDEQARLAAESLEQARNAAQERDEQARLAADALEQARKAAQERDEHARLAAGALEQVRSLEQTRDEQTRMAADALNQLAQSTASLQEQVGGLRQELADAIDRAVGLQAQLDQVRREHDEQAVRDAERREHREEEFAQHLDITVGALQQQHAKELADLAAALEQQVADQLHLQAGLLRDQNEEHQRHESRNAGERDEIGKRFAELNQMLEELTHSRRAMEGEISTLRTELEHRARSEAELRQELRESRQTAALSVRMQTLREADLKDLQVRYQASVVAQEKQHLLLTKLSERLSAASNYFHQLAAFEARPVAVAGKAARLPASPAPRATRPAPAKKAVKKAKR